MFQWIVASLHLLALPLGLGSVVVRAVALRDGPDRVALHRAFRADALWGIAALVWIATGIARAFFGLEKGTPYYLQSTAFMVKMTLLIALLALEVRPMVTLIRWRIRARRGEEIDTAPALTLSRISLVQAVLVVLMVMAATAMARGLFV